MEKDLCSLDEQLARLKQVANVDTDTALAHLLGITQGGFFNAKKRNRIPYRWFVAISTKYGVNLDWLISGKEEPGAKPPVEKDQCVPMDIIYDVIEMVEEYLDSQNSELPPSAKAEVVCRLCREVQEMTSEERARPGKVLRLVTRALAVG